MTWARNFPWVARSTPRSRYSMKLRRPGFQTAYWARLALKSCCASLIVVPPCREYTPRGSRRGMCRGAVAAVAVDMLGPAEGYTDRYRPFRSAPRSEERRVGEECRSRWSPDH